MRFSPIPEAEQLALLSTPKVRARFDIKMIPEPMSGCWLWLAAVGTSGHGQFFLRGTQYRGLIAAHRASWMIHRGPIGRLHVCHKCDNPYCVNPDHLFLGTPKDNSQDMAKKGRARMPDTVGEANSAAILTAEQVIEIRDSRLPARNLAARFGVTSTCVWEARSGVTWSHLPGARRDKQPTRFYSDEDRALILDLSNSPKALASRLNATIDAIRQQRSLAKRGLGPYRNTKLSSPKHGAVIEDSGRLRPSALGNPQTVWVAK